MEESYWIKTLLDNSSEVGSDEAITEGKASWTHGRQDISSASIFINGKMVSLHCSPNFGNISRWEQKDHYISSLTSQQTTRVFRELTCTPIEYKFIDTYETSGGTVYILNNEHGEILPSNISKISVGIKSDGQISIRMVE